MPNVLDSTGLTLATYAEVYANMSTQMQAIYGASINLASDTPDGQWLNIIVQQVLDLEDLILQVYNTFNPDTAIGNVLDQRVAINGIQRQAGTYTVTPILLVNSQSVNLYGVDQTVQPIYTISDAQGTLWVLQTTTLGLAAGSHTLSFQAAEPGATQTIPNTINVQVSVVLGVTSVNNPTTYTTLGINEETDVALKIRRALSVSLASQGYLQGLLAALENVNGVTSAFVYENTTAITDADGVPGHSIWVIVAGTGAAVDIAQAIYTKRNAGCGMKGTQSYAVTQVDGTTFIVLWDDVIFSNLFIKFTATSLNGSTAVNVSAIRSGLVTSFVPTVNQEVNVNALATAVQVIDPNCLVTSAGFSTGTVQTLTFTGTAASGVFQVNYNGNNSANINWNDSAGTIQTKIQAVTGLTAATSTGTVTGGSIVITLTALSNVAALIYALANTLMTSAPAAVTITHSSVYTDTLTPATKQKQFVLTAPNIIIKPVLLTPATDIVAPAATIAFAALGGYGSYTYSIQTNGSGCSINATTGLYTAGPTQPSSDVLKATDVLGNSGTATVTVAS